MVGWFVSLSVPYEVGKVPHMGHDEHDHFLKGYVCGTESYYHIYMALVEEIEILRF